MTRPHHYVQCDVPEGMTLEQYRAAKQPSKARKGGLVARLRRRRPSQPLSAELPRRIAA